MLISANFPLNFREGLGKLFKTNGCLFYGVYLPIDRTGLLIFTLKITHKTIKVK